MITPSDPVPPSDIPRISHAGVPQAGEVLAGKYRVERVLGVGGMGVVVAAMHIDLEQRVALKFLLAEATSHPEVAARFAREAKAAAKIQSEHVAKVLDVSTLPNGSPYMVMEYMDGEDLEHVLARMGPMPVTVATSYVLQACEAIAEAHSVGIVHRDLKPSNLFLARRSSGDPIVKVLDLGISKQTMTASQANLTRTSSILGSPLYMSPEQMASAKTVDTRSDIWALGVVFYELLAKRAPFPAETMPELVAAVLQRQPDFIGQLRPDVPPGLAAAIHRCLEKTPAGRFQNVAELAAAIAPFGPARSDVSVERISHVLGVATLASMAQMSYTQGGSPALPLQPHPYTQTGGSGASASMVAQNGGPLGGKTSAPWTGSVSESAGLPTSGGKTGMLVGIFAVLAVAATGLAYVAVKGNYTKAAAAPTTITTPADTSSAPAAPPSTAAATPPTPATATPAAADPSAAPPASASASAATDTAPPAATTAAATATPPASPAATPASPVAHATTPSAPATPKPAGAAGCKNGMLSYIDADGNKRFKPCK
jgi:eukaryotic-like serine/threonine-protein kinase